MDQLSRKKWVFCALYGKVFKRRTRYYAIVYLGSETNHTMSGRYISLIFLNDTAWNIFIILGYSDTLININNKKNV